MDAIILVAIVIVVMAVVAPAVLMKIVRKIADAITTTTHIQPLGSAIPTSLEGYRTQIFGVLAILAVGLRVANVLTQDQLDLLLGVFLPSAAYMLGHKLGRKKSA